MNNYGAQNITVLEGLEAVRKRPGMYIGTTSARGLHHLVWEVVDNSVDEALAGYCNRITVSILPDNIIQVEDNGRGIPVDIHPKYGKSALEIVLTVLHAGGKFENDNYKVSGGLHGVGISVVNALSEWTEVKVKREGNVYYQKYLRGKPIEDVKIISALEAGETTGTIVTFKPDIEIFETVIFEYEVLQHRLKELAYLNRGLEINLLDCRNEIGKKESFQFEGGISDFLKEVTQENQTLLSKQIHIEGQAEQVGVDIAFTYTTGQSEIIYSFVNNINTTEGGSHVTGFRTCLTKVINDIGKNQGFLKEKDGKLQGGDIREGIVAIISVKVPQPQFEGQTKTKLGNSEVSGIVNTVLSTDLKIFLEDNPNDTKLIIEKILNSKKAREAAQRAREAVLRKSVLEVGSLPGKLADCSSKKPEECEIFLVEGDSAGGSAKQGRDRYFQAILPLKGKILNVEKAGLHKALESDEIRAMVTAFGTNIGEESFDLEKLRYGKIILMTDADVDGAHIRTLILTFLYRYMVDLIHNGNVYIAQPPLYKVSFGKSIRYAYTDSQLKEMLQGMEGENKKYTLQRYKGLGEMNPEQLWETTMDPEARLLLKVSIDNAREADMLFDKLMGDKVEPRREFIQEHAEYVKNIDI
ncbi:DNA gyrase, B subunit [Fusobacterium necrophorum subsp. funduliforme ATCC 51357]|uniref:DNA gyrase subunit B n=1 Tax=Fusobacterium necrophorum subsp. funduliforme TaxID=143387 RepID=A0A170MXJ6_9FUSO|nr:DNA topoisomerase (ATP-hydrolyzing) subunit B [Fusobacterium necrophorum]AYV92178.1 DNA topoisomerase (ATP-hydrolyzing) subunit B [Fusobacterium necrophorum subsp. funduliforme]EIJ69539.1 DNA gyrase, B subunit [Fusobacterium necrophorum subsp. funduliforme ATCC 51357]KAB0552381.1 DNA topoisomerase (ATP-hydrolyzing) subunit B [Fusobacterium necrophorum subsp. funduliforme]KYL05041.1 DNA topoisomerase IV subunit B [Fusobacterium necrophorum subsp. funduliforme]KYM46059.1 DNA topoisomerase IV 